jgi:phosphohistidine phosphatase
MRLYLVRHGIAEQRADAADDAARALTPAGIRKTQQAMSGLRAIGCSPSLILSSRLARAWQTAQIAAEALGPGITVEREKLLESSGAAASFLDALSRRQTESAMAVGHLPGMAEIASLLLCGHTDADILFKKAAVCCLSCEPPAPGTATLEWLIQPSELRALADT